ISVQWVLFGYSIAFGHGSPLWGGLAWLGFRGVGVDPDPAYAATIPLQAHAMFQLMFAIITPALISGAIVERMRFRAYVVFVLLWATFIYDPLAHWVWGAGGWLQKLGAATGLVVGLVAITPAAGFVTAPASLVIGALAAVVSYTAIQIRARTRLDDSLDVFSCHGLGGAAGALLTGVFATNLANPAGGDGWLAGNFAQMGVQLVAVLATVALAALGTAVILTIVKATVGIKADFRAQLRGLELSEHGEEAYFGEQGAIAWASASPNVSTVQAWTTQVAALYAAASSAGDRNPTSRTSSPSRAAWSRISPACPPSPHTSSGGPCDPSRASASSNQG